MRTFGTFESLPPDVQTVLSDYAREHGRTWRSKLRWLWTTNGDTDNYALRTVRNTIGPSGLDDKSFSRLSPVRGSRR